MLFLSIIEDKKESALFSAALKQLKIPIAAIQPSYAMYLKLVQYNPNVVIIEFPHDPTEHLKFVSLVRTNQNLLQIPFIAYGPDMPDRVKENLKKYGINTYISRPFDLKAILQEAIRALKDFQKVMREKTGVEQNQVEDEVTTELLDKRIVPSKRIRLMVEHAGKMMAFPLTIANILKVSSDEKSGASNLATVVKSDPAVSTELLRVANTIHFNRGGRRVSIIKDAIVRLGFTQTKNMAASMSIMNSMKHRNYETGFSHNNFWLHCLGVAMVAEKIARQSQLVNPEEAFVCGLLHDLGIMILNEYFNLVFLKVLEHATDNGVRFVQAEKEVLGFTHIDFVNQLLESWNFDQNTIEGITTYPDLSIIDAKFVKENPLPTIVNIADVFANAFSIGMGTDACIDPIPREVMHQLGMRQGISRQFLDTVFHNFNIFNDFLRISDQRWPDAIEPLHQLKGAKLLFLSLNQETMYHPIEEYFRLRHPETTYAYKVEEVENKLGDNHVLLIPDGTFEQSKQINTLLAQKMLPYQKSEEESTSDLAKIFVLHQDPKGLKFSGGRHIAAKYPLDLRNLQLGLAMLLNDLPSPPEFSPTGSLAKQKEFDAEGRVMNEMQVLFQYFSNEINELVDKMLRASGIIHIDSVDEEKKAINHAKTHKEELNLIVLEAISPDIVKVCTALKSMPTHKRAQYIIINNGLDQKTIEGLKLIRITNVVPKNDIEGELKGFIHRMIQ